LKLKITILIIILCIISGTVLLLNYYKKSISIEINRITSPDNKVDVVLVKENGGATTSDIYKIYITPINIDFKSGHELFIVDHVKNLDIKWIQNKMLQISYDEARIFKFTNFWNSKKVDYFDYVVELKLKHNLDGFALSERDR